MRVQLSTALVLRRGKNLQELPKRRLEPGALKSPFWVERKVLNSLFCHVTRQSYQVVCRTQGTTWHLVGSWHNMLDRCEAVPPLFPCNRHKTLRPIAVADDICDSCHRFAE